MTDITILQQRLERAKAALRDAKRRERERDQARAFDLVRRSGLTTAELESLLASRAPVVPVSESAPVPAGNDFGDGDGHE